MIVARLLDVVLFSVHTALIGFNLFGWGWRRTRRLHLAAIVATLGSWFGLGVAYGWGYCPLTDWHWRIKLALGETGLPGSWVKYHLDLVTGLEWNPSLVDTLVIGCAAVALVLSLVVNIRSFLRSRTPRHPPRLPQPHPESLRRNGAA